MNLIPALFAAFFGLIFTVSYLLLQTNLVSA